MKRTRRKAPKKLVQSLPVRTVPRSGFVEDLHKRKEILLSVQGRRSERTFTFPVWFVILGETLWLLPVRGKRTQWHQNVRVNPAVAIRSGHLRRTFVVHLVDHPRTVASVVAAFRKKHTAQAVAKYYSGVDVAVEVPLNPRYSPANA